MELAGIITNNTFLFAAILILGACSGYFSERVGIANISINGQMVFGALMFAIFSEIMYEPLGKESFFLPMLLAAIFTIVSSSLFGLLTIKLKCDQIIAGTAINLLMVGLGMFLTEPLGPVLSGGVDSKLTSHYVSLVEINNSGFYLTTILLFVLFVGIVVGLYLIIKFTPFGLRLRSIGNNPNAVDAQGINVEKYQWISLTIGGVLAGFGGALFLFAANNAPFSGDVSGVGFLAIAILIAGSWRIPLLIAVSILFATITKVCENYKQNIPTDIAKMIPYVITLVAMICFSKFNKPPKNLGIPFDKTKR